MGIRYSNKEIETLMLLRKNGKTITELVELTGIPKTTVWHHVHALVLDDKIMATLRARRGGSRVRKTKDLNKAEQVAFEIRHGENSVLSKLIAMLYWAEGHKKEFVFTNTDPDMLRIYICFLHTVLNIDYRDITVLVRTSDPISPEKALSYWAKTLHLSKTAIRNNHNNTQNKTKTTYGICRIMVKKSSFYHKVIMSLVSQIKDETLRSCSSIG